MYTTRIRKISNITKTPDFRLAPTNVTIQTHRQSPCAINVTMFPIVCVTLCRRWQRQPWISTWQAPWTSSSSSSSSRSTSSSRRTSASPAGTSLWVLWTVRRTCSSCPVAVTSRSLCHSWAPQTCWAASMTAAAAAGAAAAAAAARPLRRGQQATAASAAWAAAAESVARAATAA
jgi:hypothetical protein